MAKVSVVIPTKNAGLEFEKTLKKIREQKFKHNIEIIVIDSGSIDSTVNIAKKYCDRLIQINPEEYSHGGTRNFGISISSGEYVILTVQDAIPYNNEWISSMVNNMEDDKMVAGAYSRQIPREDCNIFTKFSLENWITFGNERKEQYISSYNYYNKLSPLEKQTLVTFDNVSSCIRKSVWENFNFNCVPFGEDIEWSKRVIEGGYKIVYEPKSAVIHSHNRSVWYETKRTYVCHRTLKDMFDTHLVPSLYSVFRNFCVDSLVKISLVRKHRKLDKISTIWYMKAILLSLGTQLGMYFGGKTNIDNRKIYKNIDKILSKGV